MKILIAEDSPIVKTMLEYCMRTWGFHYDFAINGADAVSLARQKGGDYDLGIMDVSMPLVDGIAATRQIRRHVPYFPILGFSNDTAMAPTCIEAGMDDFKEKPCPPQQLLETIRELTTKLFYLVNTRQGGISVAKGKPMNSDELAELRALKKQGLTKLKLLGLERSFVVHKNIQNKISYDLIAKGKDLSEFIDRSPDEPGRCHLYKANLYITKDLLLPEELEDAIRQEDEHAGRFSEKYEVRESAPTEYKGKEDT